VGSVATKSNGSVASGASIFGSGTVATKGAGVASGAAATGSSTKSYQEFVDKQYQEYGAMREQADQLAKQTGFNPMNYLSPQVAADLYIHQLDGYYSEGVGYNATPQPIGPAEAFLRQSMGSLADNDPSLKYARYLDSLIYQNRDDDGHAVVAISVPHTAGGYWDIAQMGQDMNPVQHVGIENTIVILGDRQTAQSAEMTYNQMVKNVEHQGELLQQSVGGVTYSVQSNFFSGEAPGGIIFVDTGNNWNGAGVDKTFEEILRHESEHAGINAMNAAYKQGVVTNNDTGRLVSSIAAGVRISDIVESKDAHTGVSFLPIKGGQDVISLQTQVNPNDPNDPRNYVNSLNEVLAFTNAGTVNQDVLAHNISQAYGLDDKSGKEVVQELQAMPSLHQVNYQLGENADYVSNYFKQQRTDLAKSSQGGH